jgi:hypothetical protein
MKQITKQEMVELVSANKGAEPVSIDIMSDITKTLKKTGNPFLSAIVTKSTTLSGFIGFDYENSVNRQLGREGKEQEFESHPRSWGTLINPYFVEHKGSYYLQMKVEASSMPVYRVDRVEVPVEKVEAWLPKKSEPKTQSELDKKVILRDVKVDNILALRYNGESYLIV